MNIVEVNVGPRRLDSGQYTLYETTTYDQPVPGKPWISKSKRIVWPPCKQKSKRGKPFDTYKEAVQFFVDNRDHDVHYGQRTHLMMEHHVGN